MNLAARDCSMWVLALACSSSGCEFNSSPLGPQGIERETSSATVQNVRDPNDFSNAPGAMGSAGSIAVMDVPAPTTQLDASTSTPAEPVADAASTVANDGSPADELDSAAAEADAGLDAAPPMAGDAAPAPVHGALFSTCTENTDCDSGLICTSVLDTLTPGGSSAGGYCATFCGTSEGSLDPCPQPTSGTVAASCQLTSTLCMLESCERLECPTGLRCVDTPTSIGTGETLHAYACQP